MRKCRLLAVPLACLEQAFLEDVSCSLHEEVAGADRVSECVRPFFELDTGWWCQGVDREWRGIASNSEHDEISATRCAQEAAVVAFEVEDHEGHACREQLHEQPKEQC